MKMGMKRPYTLDQQLTMADNESSMKMQRIPAYGDLMHSDVIGSDRGLRFVNCSPIVNDQAGSDPIVTVEPRPFFDIDFDTLPGNPLEAIRNVYSLDFASARKTYYAVGDGLYDDAEVKRITFSLDTGYVGITHTPTFLIVVENKTNNSIIHSLNLFDNTLVTETLATGTSGDPVYLDGYIFLSSSPLNQTLFNSSLAVPTDFDLVNDYIDAEQFPDKNVFIAKHRNHIVAFGTQSIEFFSNAGHELGSPLQRNTSYATEIGAFWDSNTDGFRPVATTIGDDIYFLGVDKAKRVALYKLSNFRITKVSNTYMDRLFENYQGVLDYRAFRDSVKLMSVKAYGTNTVLCVFNTENSQTKNQIYVLHPEQGNWSEWTLPFYINGSNNIQEYNLEFTQTDGDSTNQTTAYVNSQGTGYKAKFLNQNSTKAPETIRSTILTGMMNFKNQYDKTWISTDVLGYYSLDNTSINLKTYRHSDYTSYTDHGYKMGRVLRMGLIRFRNLGRSRQIAFEVTISSDRHYIYEGMDIVYEQGLG